MSGFNENETSKVASGGTEIISRKLQSILDPELLKNFQIIPSRVRELDEDKIRIVFFNDLAGDPEVAKFSKASYRDKFHHFVFISDWQYQQYRNFLGFEYSDKCSVIEVGFDPITVDFETRKTNSSIKLCYTSTPQRGLHILSVVFDNIVKTNPDLDIHLDVFSSFKIYGREEQDQQFEPLYDTIRNHSNMTYHGFTPHEELIKYLPTADIFAYPCIWEETSCRAMEEAMSAGLLCVHPNWGALPDTSGHLNMMYQGHADQNIHAGIFHEQLLLAIHATKEYKLQDNNTGLYYHLLNAKHYADSRYNISKVEKQWTQLLTKLLNKHPVTETRKPKDVLIFNTTTGTFG